SAAAAHSTALTVLSSSALPYTNLGSSANAGVAIRTAIRAVERIAPSCTAPAVRSNAWVSLRAGTLFLIVRRAMATHLPVIGGHAEGFGKTVRTDGWWQGPAITFAVFSTFVVYTTWAALQGNHYYAAPYLSPFYSPVLFTEPNALVHGGAPVDIAWF